MIKSPNGADRARPTNRSCSRSHSRTRSGAFLILYFNTRAMRDKRKSWTYSGTPDAGRAYLLMMGNPSGPARLSLSLHQFHRVLPMCPHPSRRSVLTHPTPPPGPQVTDPGYHRCVRRAGSRGSSVFVPQACPSSPLRSPFAGLAQPPRARLSYSRSGGFRTSRQHSHPHPPCRASPPPMCRASPHQPPPPGPGSRLERTRHPEPACRFSDRGFGNRASTNRKN